MAFTFTDRNNKVVLHSWGRFKAVLSEEVKVGDLLNNYASSASTAMRLADDSDGLGAIAVACQDGIAGDEITCALAAELKAPVTLGAGGVATQTYFCGATDFIGSALYLGESGKAESSSGTTVQQIGICTARDTVIFYPGSSITGAAGSFTTLVASAATSLLGTVGITGALTLLSDIDMSTSATTTYDLILKDAVADALSIRRATTDMIVFDSSTPKITITPATTITGLLTTTGGITNNSAGIAAAGAISGATTVAASTSVTVTSANASALAVGRLGATTPALVVDASTATSITGISIKSAATGGGVAIAAAGEASVALTINAYGTGTIGIGSVSTGAVTITPATTVVGTLTIGADAAGTDFTLYGAVTAYKAWWDANGDTNGMMIFGADTKGVDVKAFGATTGNYLLWDASADDLLLTGTATQLAVAGTTSSTTTTTGSLRTAGGLGVVENANIGGSATITGAVLPAVSGTPALGSATLMWSDLFLKSGAVINFNNGDVTLTHSSNTLAMAGGNLTVGGTVGITVADAGLTVTCATLNATTGRVGKFVGSVAAPNLGDGYGAVEVDVTFTGTYAGISAALSAWVNVTGTGAVGSYIVAAQNNGIYADSDGNTGSTVIFGMRAQGILTDAPTVFAPFSINTSNREITALFHMTSNPDVGYLANVGTSGGKVGDVPLFCDAAGQQYFVRIYSARG